MQPELRFIRFELLERWKDLKLSDVVSLQGGRTELVQLLESRYGFHTRRAEQEVDEFLAAVQEKIERAHALGKKAAA